MKQLFISWSSSLSFSLKEEERRQRFCAIRKIPRETFLETVSLLFLFCFRLLVSSLMSSFHFFSLLSFRFFHPFSLCSLRLRGRDFALRRCEVSTRTFFIVLTPGKIDLSTDTYIHTYLYIYIHASVSMFLTS